MSGTSSEGTTSGLAVRTLEDIRAMTASLGRDPEQELLEAVLGQRQTLIDGVLLRLRDADSGELQTAAEAVAELLREIREMDVRLEKVLRERMRLNREEIRSLNQSARVVRAYTAS